MFDGKSRRIHITGAPRSGTTLLHVMFLACFDIDGRIREEQRLRKPVPPGRRVTCTKCPGEVEAATAILRMDRRLDVVCMMRDPRDVIVSRHGAHPDRYFTNLRVWRRAALAAERARRRPRFHLVDYRHLVSDPDGVQEALMTAMPHLKRLHRFSDYHRNVDAPSAEWLPAMHDIRAVSSTSLQTWRAHLERVKGQMIVHGDLADELIALGYEPDRSWMGSLIDVEPDLAPSVQREHLSAHKALSERLPRVRDAALYMMRRGDGRLDLLER